MSELASASIKGCSINFLPNLSANRTSVESVTIEVRTVPSENGSVSFVLQTVPVAELRRLCEAIGKATGPIKEEPAPSAARALAADLGLPMIPNPTIRPKDPVIWKDAVANLEFSDEITPKMRMGHRLRLASEIGRYYEGGVEIFVACVFDYADRKIRRLKFTKDQFKGLVWWGLESDGGINSLWDCDLRPDYLGGKIVLTVRYAPRTDLTILDRRWMSHAENRRNLCAVYGDIEFFDPVLSTKYNLCFSKVR